MITKGHQDLLRTLRGTFLLLTCVLASATQAQYGDAFERILVPISVSSVPGAYGTLWSTELWYRNNSPFPVAIQPLAVADAIPTIGRTELLPIGSFPAHAPGQILFVSRQGSEDVQFDLRLFNRADPWTTWGTKLPVVWEREFAAGVHLINVPTGNDFRAALRIYGFPEDWAPGESAHVRIYSHDEQLLAEARVSLHGVPRYGAILSLSDTFPHIRQKDRVRVHVESGRAAKLWAFVSVTSNATQFVSVVTPE
ncbi:MAG TPA: hypothetical protein VE010_06520 [Thermoanaerobaculia bacterium]|nr:hypothetical protein [Thermoanaerobaculia bacterium]